MTEKLTIMDIARLAGVSKATVSRVLNQKLEVDSKTRERILRIMEEQGFVPSITASNLAGGRSRLLGALVPSLSWPLIPDLMRGIGEVVGSTSYELILYSINDVYHEKDRGDVIDRIVGTRLTAGLLAVFPGPSAKYLAKLHSRDYPVVLIDDQGKSPGGIPWISVDNRAGAYEATRHLIDLGHRRIAHIQGPLKYQVSHDRYQGYCDALNEAGISLTSPWYWKVILCPRAGVSVPMPSLHFPPINALRLSSQGAITWPMGPSRRQSSTVCTFQRI